MCVDEKGKMYNSVYQKLCINITLYLTLLHFQMLVKLVHANYLKADCGFMQVSSLKQEVLYSNPELSCLIQRLLN